MKDLSESSPARWTRHMPWQFSLRALLVLITIAALFVWWYAPRPPVGTITEAQLKLIKVGLTQDDVRSLLGKPAVVMRLTLNPPNEIWMYRVAIANTEEGTLNISFPPGSKIVGSTTRSKHLVIDSSR